MVASPLQLLESTLADRLARELGLDAAYLFGSVARGTPRAHSDIDLGLLFASSPAATLAAQPFHLEADLTLLLKRPVSIVVMNVAPPDLVHRILRDGILILEGNRSRRIAFEVRMRNAWWDLLPVLRQYRKVAP